MGTNDAYPWTRRESETPQAWEGFRTYLDLRSLTKVSESLNKSHALMARWSRDHDWVERVRAYDVYLTQAQTDGQVDWVTNARSETQTLADKLRGLLSDRLDDCIRLKQDPTVRWSQAAGVLIKMQDAAVAPVSDEKMAAELDRVARLLEKVTGEPVAK